MRRFVDTSQLFFHRGHENLKLAVPPKIKIFSRQLILDKQPSNLQIATRNGPSNGACAMCGAPEDTAHILFSYSLGKFS
jgi:hypothetical protein